MQREKRFTEADRIIRVSFIANMLLMVMKLTAGSWGNSAAVFADGAENGCDLVVLIMTMIALAVGRRPFDDDHPYGHGRAENISALIVALAIFASGILLLLNAAHSIVDKNYSTPHAVAVLAAVVTIVVKELLYRASKRVGDMLDSPAVLAVAKDHRKDTLATCGTFFGVTGGYLGLGILDPLAALVIAVCICRIGYTTFIAAAHDLMDGMPSPELVKEIREAAAALPGVDDVHEIRARRAGQFIVVDLKLDMNPQMTVKESHDIATAVKKEIFRRFPGVGDVMIHVNPHREDHEDLIRL